MLGFLINCQSFRCLSVSDASVVVCVTIKDVGCRHELPKFTSFIRSLIAVDIVFGNGIYWIF